MNRGGVLVKQELDRRLVAIMFTDMVGYTALIEMDERLAIEKRDRYVGSVERFHDRFGGQIVQRLGDGTLSMFSKLSVMMAMRSSFAPDDA